ncbi:hypothetical protein AVEN_37889-1 [Araneus ventricosus]|uniref:Uncharacterized protein n=1 Tax=Araneus ventricosus TaxID=182803 RepID=A0A4Y2V1H7_ARAVE|nr:hypothetical protein AVEN_37889-1 [Araneus ventricosus]
MSLLITKFHQSVVCGQMEGVENRLSSRNVSRKSVLQERTLTVRHCSNFSPSSRKEITKARYLTLGDALQRCFDDDEKSEIYFVVISHFSRKSKVGGEEEEIKYFK